MCDILRGKRPKLAIGVDKVKLRLVHYSKISVADGKNEFSTVHDDEWYEIP